ncbi:hypothetical protein VTK73DRAFT_557 [Phialemonium thermophilum]|uniref:Uncharacterized protein n=1 Tax=Phialemonium thermophilum TaxID=223376 RepID=A0ABR3VUT7_9PEZI
MSGSERPGAKRVLIVVSRTSNYWAEAWTAPANLMSTSLRLLQDQELIPPTTLDDPSAVTFVAKERWDVRTFLVLDIWHAAYDPDTAHLPGQNELPVVVVSFGRGEAATAYRAGTPTENRVDRELRDLHDRTGPGSRPPFEVDHADGKQAVIIGPWSLRRASRGRRWQDM